MNDYNPLAKDYTVRSLLRFAFPTIAMMVFMGLYTIVDSIFISRLVNTLALSALNIVTPMINLIVGLGAMLATGGSAIVARKLGNGNDDDARNDFSLITLTTLCIGLLIGIAGLLFLKPIVRALGASELLSGYAGDYLRLMLVFAPANMLQVLFSIFLIAAGKPRLGLVLGVTAGLVNAVFDFVFMGPMQMGISGAALATSMGYMITAVGGIVFFMRNKTGAIHFAVPRLSISVIGESLFNGSSEMVGHLSSAVTTLLFNLSMMKLAGENGVAAITIIIYSQFLLSTFFIGFSIGVAPIFSFNYGNRNHERMKRLFGICNGFIAAVSLGIFILAMLCAPYLTGAFSPEGTAIYALARNGFYIIPAAFLFCGFNIFASSLFTAISNGRISAAISFLRSLAFLSAGIAILPRFFGIWGIWMAPPAAEACTLAVAAVFVLRNRKRYHYL